MKNRTITVKGTEVTVTTRHEQDYISLTDMVKNFEGAGALIEQWLKNKDTVLFLGVWEQLNNPGFNSLEFEGIRATCATMRHSSSSSCCRTWRASTHCSSAKVWMLPNACVS